MRHYHEAMRQPTGPREYPFPEARDEDEHPVRKKALSSEEALFPTIQSVVEKAENDKREQNWWLAQADQTLQQLKQEIAEAKARGGKSPKADKLQRVADAYHAFLFSHGWYGSRSKDYYTSVGKSRRR